MDNLDDQQAMRKLDPSGVWESTASFPDQCLQAWREASVLKFPADYAKVTNVVVCGMGGSRFTPRTIKELYRDAIRVPYEIVEDYTLPGYVGPDSLVILSSYSGTTEEVISCGKQALERGAKLTAVVKGDAISDLIKTQELPAYIFTPEHNPCGQPRIGGGYLLMGHLGLLWAMHLIKLDPQEVESAIAYARTVGKTYFSEPTITNPAKKLAILLMDKHPFIVTAEFLKGFGNGFANQINETAKLISDYRYIPELNHHLMEGLKRPESLHSNGLFVLITSKFYSPAIQKRFVITREVVAKQNVATHVVEFGGPSKLAQVLEAFSLSGFTTFYLAMLYDTDPVAIPWVDYFKAQLAK